MAAGLFCDQKGTQVAAAHAGWRGLAAGVLLETLNTFEEPSKVSAYLCPAIGPEAFEVGPEVKAAFVEAPDVCFHKGHHDRWYADLYELARWQLMQAGVGEVLGGKHCTFSEPEQYFSYRRDGVTGRQASMIWIESSPAS